MEFFYLQAPQELGLDTADLIDEQPSILHLLSQPTSQEHREYNCILLCCLIIKHTTHKNESRFLPRVLYSTEITFVPSELPSVSAATNVTEDMEMATEGKHFCVNIALVMLVITIASPTDTKSSLYCFSYFLQFPSVSPPSNEAEMAMDGELL